jgi:hypothetical protein
VISDAGGRTAVPIDGTARSESYESFSV